MVTTFISDALPEMDEAVGAAAPYTPGRRTYGLTWTAPSRPVLRWYCLPHHQFRLSDMHAIGPVRAVPAASLHLAAEGARTVGFAASSAAQLILRQYSPNARICRFAHAAKA